MFELVQKAFGLLLRFPFFVLDNAAAFWRFVLSASHRETQLGRFRSAAGRARSILAMRAALATTAAVGVFALLAYLVAR